MQIYELKFNSFKFFLKEIQYQIYNSLIRAKTNLAHHQHLIYSKEYSLFKNFFAVRRTFMNIIHE